MKLFLSCSLSPHIRFISTGFHLQWIVLTEWMVQCVQEHYPEDKWPKVIVMSLMGPSFLLSQNFSSATKSLFSVTHIFPSFST
jgi:hypothetical protein